MSDEEFEKFLQREAKSYNEPPAAIPRDEMFAAITVERRARAAQPAPASGGSRITRFALIGMAATLVIGVAIGKYGFVQRDSAAAPQVASQPNDTTSGAQRPADANGNTYAVATTAQLVRAEALLTAYTASGADAKMDKQLSTWARDILSNTRLLLDSPAATDPARRKLLEDLEVVLVQMVQRSPADGSAGERAQIDRSIEHNQVLSRLRSALPVRHSGT